MAGLDALRSAVSGSVLAPGDPAYDETRTLYNAMFDKRPAVVVTCSSAEDVAAAIRYAREEALEVAIRGGGHNGAGLGSVDDGLVLDLRGLREVQVDPEAKTVRVGGGCTWGEVDAATGEHGLATPSGIISTTGVGGLTLGGGLGHLTRAFGLTIDNLLETDVVLAGGERVRASDEEHPDLFWALRGGGGNFGVVTSFLFRLHEVPQVFAGPTFWDVEQSREVLAVYRDFIRSAPRELNGFFAYHFVPPAEPFPEELHGRPVCGVVWCYLGDEDAGAKGMAPLLDSTPEPLMHGVATMPHTMLQAAFDGLYPPGDQWYWRSDLVVEIPDDAVELHHRFGSALPTGQSTMHMYPVDGAAHDVPADATAWGYRHANWNTVFAGVDGDPASRDALRKWSVEYQTALHPHSAGGGYVNMMMTEDGGEERVRRSYGENYERLARVKKDYDPDNFFHVNQNIRPAE
jgi:FAD/FMN-containing dehydrogenase